MVAPDYSEEATLNNPLENVALLFQRRFDVLVVARAELVLRDHAGAGIPTKQGVVISGRTNSLGFLEPVHGFAEAFIGLMVAARRAAREVRFGAAFGQYPAIIGGLVFAFNPGQNLFRLGVAHTIAFAKAIG